MTTPAALQLLKAQRAAKARAKELKQAEPKKQKYKAEPVFVDGVRFDSKREAQRWTDLNDEVKASNRISDLRRQVKIPLLGRDGPILTPKGRPAHYVADFVYFDNIEGREIIEDAKGFPTPEYLLKRAILAAQGIQIKET